MRYIFGRSDGSVVVSVARAASCQQFEGGEDGGPAVEREDGGDQVDCQGDGAVDGVDIEECHHHHDTHRAGQDDVQHGQDEEWDQQRPHLSWSVKLCRVDIAALL